MKKPIKIILIILSVILLIGLLLIGIGYVVFNRYYSMIQVEPKTEDYEILESIHEEYDIDEQGKPIDTEFIDIIDPEETTVSESEQEIPKIETQLPPVINETVPEKIEPVKDVYNVLLIGSDSRSVEKERGRSDAMILISINNKSQSIVMTSIMRDTYLTIPRVGGNRINASYAFGGASLLIDTIEYNFGIPIDNYVSVTFEAFTNVVDSLGGVTITLTEAEIPYVDKNLTAGEVHLNGEQTLNYCRIRRIGSDFQRTERQRITLLQLIKNIKKKSLGELNTLAETILPLVKTDMSAQTCLSLVLKAFTTYKDYSIETFRIPMDGTYKGVYINRMSVLSTDLKANRDAFYKLVYDYE